MDIEEFKNQLHNEAEENRAKKNINLQFRRVIFVMIVVLLSIILVKSCFEHFYSPIVETQKINSRATSPEEYQQIRNDSINMVRAKESQKK